MDLASQVDCVFVLFCFVSSRAREHANAITFFFLTLVQIHGYANDSNADLEETVNDNKRWFKKNRGAPSDWLVR